MKHKVLSLIAILTICVTASPACPDFTDLNSPYVTAFTGTTSDPFAHSGAAVPGRHTEITTSGTDPNTGGALQLLPPGESKVIKLGNAQVGAEAEALSYRFTVDRDHAVLMLKFAVVLEDPGHNTVQQPRFVVRVKDQDGNLTEDCAEYDVSAGADIPGFQTYQYSSWTTVRWRDWTNVGLDLSKYIGQEVQLQFITYDCAQSGHFGYAYFTASCMSNLLQLTDCGTPFQVSAPDNFASYLWDNGEQTRTTTRTQTSGGMWCNVTSATGCQFTLSGYVTDVPVSTPDFIQATICEGESYNENYFSLPPQSPGTHKYYNTFINPATCDDGRTIELELKVIPRYTRIKAAICHGEDYTENGFNIIQPAVGVRRDTVWIGQTADCDEYNVLELTVNVSLSMPNVIEGDPSPCTYESVTYAFAGSDMLTRFEWEFPDNAFITRGRFTSQVTLYYTDDTPGQILLKGENGCGTGATPLSIHPRMTHHIQLNDTVCQGNEYNRYNFNLGIRDSVGFFVYEKHLTSSLGCDSSVVLALNVLPTPVVRIEPKDPVLCNPEDEIKLHAVTGDMQWANAAYYPYDRTLTPTDAADFIYYHNVVGPALYVDKYTGTSEIVVIPAQIDGRDVTMVSGYFQGVSEIFLPSTVTVIFVSSPPDDCTSLDSITIPESVIFIHDDAFVGCSKLTIRCYEGSYAHQFAETNGIPFELIDTKNYPFVYIYDCELNYLWNTGDITGSITQYPTETTTYTVKVSTQSGCWATASMPVIVNTHAPVIVRDTICAGETYTGYGFNATTTDIYTTTIQEDDCTVDVAVHLFVRPAITRQITGAVCAGDRFTEHGLDIALHQPGIFRDTMRFISHTGCDSTVMLEITVHPVEEITLRDTVCQYQPYNKNGFDLPAQNITGESTYTRTEMQAITPVPNCFNTIILKLTVNPVITNIISDEVRRDSAYNKYNFDFPKVTKDTTATQNLTSSLGCDSTVILNLKANDLCQLQSTLSINICDGDSYLFKGEYLTVPGTYRDTLTATNSCDSIVTLHLTVNLVPTVTVVEKTVCQNDSVHLVFTGVAPFELNYTFNGARENMTVYGMDTVLIATQAGENIFTVYRLISGNGCSIYDGVEINGLIWATRNVDAPGTFAAKPEDAGMFYQWNITTGWSTADPLTNTNGGTTWNPSENWNETWETSNNVCPTDWRVPEFYTEMMSSLNNTNVNSYGGELNGVYGQFFESNGQTMFLPAAGFRFGYSGNLDYVGTQGHYWSGTVIPPYTDPYFGSNQAHSWFFYNGNNYIGNRHTLDGRSVRCVKDPQKDVITVNQPDTVRISDAIFVGEDYNKNGFTIPVQNVATTLLDTLHRKNTNLCDSTVILTLEVKGGVIIQPIKAVNDTLIYVSCNNSSLTSYRIQVLDNDLIPCSNPAVRILSSSISSAFAWPDGRIQFDAYYPGAGEYKDSIQYEVSCGIEKDTAWFYLFKIEDEYPSIKTLTATCNEIYIETEEALPPGSYFYIEKEGSDFSDDLYTGHLNTIKTATFSGLSAGKYDVKVCRGFCCVDDHITITADTVKITAAICQGETYILNGFNENTAGIHIKNLIGVNLCDSVVALNLTVNPFDITQINKTIRVGEGYNENGFAIPVQDADTTISKTLHLQNQHFCDSTVILTLNVVSCVPDMVPIFDSICEGEPYYFDSKLLLTSGIYFESGINSVGCDSITVLDFKVLPRYYNDIYEEIAEGETYILNGRPYGKDGVYSETLVSVSNCDSVVILHLNVIPKPKCPDIEIPAFFTPNFDGVNDYWKIKNIECYSYYKVTLYDRFGKKLYVWENDFPEIGWDGTYLGKPVPSTDYWYLITIEEIQGNYIGHFSLMR